MSEKNVNFGDKKGKKSDFYKNKKVIKIHDVNKILVSKEEPYGTNTWSDTMIMTLLDDYA